MFADAGLDYTLVNILALSGLTFALHLLMVGVLRMVTGNAKETAQTLQKRTDDCEHATYLFWSEAILFWCVIRGWQIWVPMDMASLDAGLVYTRIPGADDLTAVMCVYQVYNILVCLRIPSYCTPEFLIHHLVTATLCWMGLESMTPTTGYCVGYYGVYFIGVAETSNLLLAAMDVFKYNLFGLQEACPTVNEVCRVSFAISFIILRLVFWPMYSFAFWVENVSLLQQGAVHSQFVAIFYLVANAGLTFLQFFWGQKVLRGLAKFLGIGGQKKKAQKEA